ncbi:MAG: ATP-binding protein [Proteobacteria bacterium]|nr:MAG: ATP-binding protein [Pseudomonadota bacterium]
MYTCPCGFLLGSPKDGGKPCTCTAPQIRRYLSRISGPLLDRIDIHIEVPRLSSQELMGKATGETSATVRKRVVAARKIQTERMSGSGITCNAQMKAKGLRDYCDMDTATKDLLKAAIAQFSLSGRGYDRILKVSRTIADLEESEMIQLHHVAEAINYRAFDRKLFG